LIQAVNIKNKKVSYRRETARQLPQNGVEHFCTSTTMASLLLRNEYYNKYFSIFTSSGLLPEFVWLETRKWPEAEQQAMPQRIHSTAKHSSIIFGWRLWIMNQ